MRFRKKTVFRISGIFALIICIILNISFFSGTKKKSHEFFVEQSEEQQSLVQNGESGDTDVTPNPEEKTSSSDKEKEHSRAYTNRRPHEVENDRVSLTGKTEDNEILLKWDVPVDDAVLKIEVQNGTDFTQEKTENVKGKDEYRFRNGIHGKLYRFVLEYETETHNQKNKKIEQRFINFQKLPNIETLFIDTEDGLGPTYEKAKKSDKNLFGMTIINNEYKQATLNKNTPVKIGVRGNASAYGPKKSYKIAFEEPKDMLGLGEEYADKEWILLGKRDLFKTYFGIELSKAVGMEWEPRMRFVNLILNGDWKGLYILCESIKRHPKRVDVDEDGFLIESDGYYWKEKAPVFRSPLLSEKVGFTFKYPKVTSDSDDRFLEIKKHFQEIDKAVENMSDNLGDLIDFETFAAWALVHEIMGTKDGFGSNMFFYQKSIGQKTKLKMGPAWDFDSVLPKSNFKPASFWYTKGTYLSFLQEHPKFREY